MVPASEDENIKSGVLSFVGVLILLSLAEISGAVVSVVVLSVEVVSSSVVLSLSVVAEVVEEPLSLLLLHEMMVKLKRNMETMMSICLIWFPISGLGEPNI